jgi:hypothetical protein
VQETDPEEYVMVGVILLFYVTAGTVTTLVEV